MTYLLLSNLILVIIPMLLMFASKTTKYPEKLDLFFTVLTFCIIVFGFIPEHISSMTPNNLLLLVVVFLALEIMERLGSIEKISGSKRAGRAYFLFAFLLITFHTFLDGMGFHLESVLSHEASHEHAHTHDFYSLSLGLLLHRFPIGVFIYHKFFTHRASYTKGFLLISAMIASTFLGYIEFDSFSKFFGAEKFAHTFEYIVVALLLHFVVTHIYNNFRSKKC